MSFIKITVWCQPKRHWDDIPLKWAQSKAFFNTADFGYSSFGTCLDHWTQIHTASLSSIAPLCHRVPTPCFDSGTWADRTPGRSTYADWKKSQLRKYNRRSSNWKWAGVKWAFVGFVWLWFTIHYLLLSMSDIFLGWDFWISQSRIFHISDSSWIFDEH